MYLMVNKRVLLVSLVLFLSVFIFLNVVTLRFFETPLSPVAMTGKVVESGLVRVYVEGAPKIITIYTTENTTYRSDKYTWSGAGHPKCDDYRYILPLNVSVDFYIESVDGWKYSLYDLEHSVYIEQDTLFDPNTTINSVRWGNLLSVSALEEDADWVTQEVVFTIEVPNSAPTLGYINDHIFICESERLDERFNATDVDEETLTHSISPPNPFYTDYLGRVEYKHSLFSIISGSLSKDDLGNHSEIISVVDPTDQSDSKSINITVIEINNLPVMEDIGAQTVWMNGSDSSFNHQMVVADVEDGDSSDGNMTFNLSWENDENLFSINSSTGVMNYTPLEGHQGASSLTYSLTVCVEDNPLASTHENISLCLPRSNNSESVCDSFTLTVTEENRAPEIVSYTPNESLTVPGTTTTVFEVEVIDDDGTVPDIDWYLDGVLKEHNENKSSDSYSYSFGCGVSGNYNLTIITTDGLLSDSQTWEITVTNVDCPVQEVGGGGGGGGGSIGGACYEKWVCDAWDVCQNVQRSFDAKVLSPEDYYSTKELCVQNEYDERFCGFQIAACRDLNSCNNSVFEKLKPSEIRVCYFTEGPSCDDGITNCHDGACELLVDCGGPCPSCASCSDGAQNQGEFGIDCGGPCPYACEAESPLRITGFIIVILVIVLLIAIIFIGLKVINIFRYRFLFGEKKKKEKKKEGKEEKSEEDKGKKEKKEEKKK